MTLIKSLSAQAEERYRFAQLGKYFTFAHGATANTGFSPLTIDSDKTVLLEGPADDIFAQLDIAVQKQGNKGYAIVNSGDFYSVYFPNFLASARKLKVFLRPSGKTLTKAAEDLLSTSPAAKVAVNASLCEYSGSTSTPADPALVTPVGHVYSGNAAVGGGRPSPLGFRIQFFSNLFTFGQGDAANGEGIGGLVPVLQYNTTYSKVWKYGEKNEYVNLPSGSSAPETGDPQTFGSYLAVRSSSAYKDQNKATTGKTIIGYNAAKDALAIMVQNWFYLSGGYPLDHYRNILFSLGFENAVSLDGSDSVMLYDFSSKKFLVSPGGGKDNYLEVGIGITF